MDQSTIERFQSFARREFESRDAFTAAFMSEFNAGEMEMFVKLEMEGRLFSDEVPAEDMIEREKSLDSPAYLITQHLDPAYYGRHFEPVHYQLIDDVLAPWLIGETATIEGVDYDPHDFRGLLILFSRSTLKSTILRMLAQWIAPYRKYREHSDGCAIHGKRLQVCDCGGVDARTMFVHQVIEKARQHSIAMRETSKHHKAWRRLFGPAFSPTPSKEWDTTSQWRWPGFETYLATEWSMVVYGESSSKEGGHYTERLVDDWVTEDSVGNATQLEKSFENFRKMDNLRDRTAPYNPWVAVGTHYHYQDAYRRLEAQGGWMVWRMPAHTGSPKAIFDLCAIEDRMDAGRRKIEVGLRRLEKDPPGDLNFPKLLPWRELYHSARMEGPHTYNTQLLLNPKPEGEQRFSVEAISASRTRALPEREDCWLVVRCDPAISLKKTADECAMLVIAIDWRGVRWVVDGWVGREKRPNKIVLRTFTFAKDWQARGYRVLNIGFESVAYQEALAELARNGVPERDATYDGEKVKVVKKPCAIRSIKRSTDMRKHERILEMDGPITRRELRVCAAADVSDRLLKQLENFPFDKDDLLDALHDGWGDASPVPARPTEESPERNEFFERLLRKRKKKGLLKGTTQVVDLASWSA